MNPSNELEETERLLSQATFAGVKQLLSGHIAMLKKNGGDGNKPKVEAVSASSANLPPPPPLPVATTSVPSTITARPSIVSDKTLSSSSGAFIPISDFAWDQGGYNSPTVSIFVDLPGVGTIKDQVEFSSTPSSFDLKITGLDGKNYRLVKDSLGKDIVPAESKIIVKKDKIVIKLQKVKGEYSYEHWTGLTSKNKRDSAAEADKKKDPMGGLMDMMKNMYDEGDENMKKIIGEAMMKSRSGEKMEPPAMDDL